METDPKTPLTVTSTPTITKLPPALPPKRLRISSTKSSPPSTPQSSLPPDLKSPVKSLPDLLEHTTNNPTQSVNNKPENQPYDIDLMEKDDISDYLIFKKPEEDGPDIKGGYIDALIIQATKATKNGGEFWYFNN